MSTFRNVLDISQMMAVSIALTDLVRLRKWILTHPLAADGEIDDILDTSRIGVDQHGGEIPLLYSVAASIKLPDIVLAALDSAFDSKQRLSEVKFPQLKHLRTQAEALERQVSSYLRSRALR